MTDYWQITTTALGTGLATAIFTQGFALWRDTRRDQSSSRYLAIRLAVLLEKYALDCADIISEDDPEVIPGLPALPDYPDEESWKTLQPILLEKALSLAHEVTLSRQYIAFEWDVSGPSSMGDEAANQCGKCGYLAWSLAQEMRAKYRLPSFDPLRTGWDIAGALRGRYEAVLKAAKARNSN